jgi:hypothetical protein
MFEASVETRGGHPMTPEARLHEDYGQRQVEAARRVLVDLGQVLASFQDCLVVVGGWVPDLLLPGGDESHVGSIDVDLALDAGKLIDGRYAELLQMLLDTGRYRLGTKAFQLVVEVPLQDGEKPVLVEVDFLAPLEVKLGKNKPKLIEGFRVLQTESCAEAFHDPVTQTLAGRNVRGASNSVSLRIASLSAFLVMKAHAIGNRDKPKDSYDLCFALEHFPGGMESVAREWKSKSTEPLVQRAVWILREKFAAMESFGPQQVVEFYDSVDADEQALQARNAYELVQRFLHLQS